uniref:ArfGAP with RhoGAP domain, ankyrin repeat and PH domain 3 n=1 Tax=Fundulus heteroclitus TaxID=8078 RepID=A0A3Q2SXM0_FUNHE
PPVPPRLNRSTAASVSPPSSAERRPPASLLGRPGSLDSTRLSGSSGSPRGGSMEMVSNEIYWGTSPSSSTDDPEEEISPYCEAVFLTRRFPRFSWTKRLSQAFHAGDSQGYSTVGEAPPPFRSSSLPPHTFLPETDDDMTISPYASYASLTERAPPIISGWLDKLSPQLFIMLGNDRANDFWAARLSVSEELDSDAPPEQRRDFITQKYREGRFRLAHPAFSSQEELLKVLCSAVSEQTLLKTVTQIFSEALRRRWVATLQEHVRDHRVFGRRRFGPGSHCQKHGVLELKGTKSKVYAAINTDQIWLYKSEQCFRNGIGITVIEARGATIRDGKHRSFELITPYKTFSFTAESGREKRDWMEALQEAIAETLSDYEVAEKIWSNRSNRTCADCKALNPDWASINLCVVICKNCANYVFQKRFVKFDGKNLMYFGSEKDVYPKGVIPLAAIQMARPAKDNKFEIVTSHRIFVFRTDNEQHRGLGTMVSKVQSLKLDTSVWSNEIVQPSVYDEIMQPVLHSGFLYKASSLSRGTLSRKTREDFQKFWCSVDQALVLYESDHSADPCLQISVKDIVCLGVSRPDSSSNNNGFIDFRYTFELYVASEKLLLFGLETADALHSWTKAIGQAATPLSCHCLLTREFERVGLLRYRAMLDPQQWREAYFVLQKSNLFVCPRNDGAAEDIINLNRLQELITSEHENHEKKDILVLVEKGTVHLQGVGRTDFSLWYADIQRAAGGKGNALREQQMSRSDIPIIVDSCIAFITQYLGHEGIYRKNGAKSRIRLLMDEFRKDARNVKLRIGDHFIEDVTDVLKRFFREIDDPIFMAELHPLWQEAAIPQKRSRLDRYKEIIRSLPRVNRTTLAALISHLYVQKCADLNQMCTKNLSLLFAPSLFQTDGKGEHEVKIVEDLIDNYLYVFELSQAGDLIIEVYLEMKIPDCCITLKVSPTMCAEELTNQVLYMRNVPAGEKDVWMTFEAIEDGQLRPLHPKEKVLEQALQWCKMADPSSAYLVVKRVPKGEGINILYKSEIMKIGLLRCREEPPKLLQGNRFQERTFQIRDHKLLLLKDKKSIKPEKEWALKSMRIYIGIRRKLKAPSWGFTVMSDKHQCEAELWDWVTSFLRAQNDDPGPPVLRRHSSSDISKQKFGTMPLVPIRGDESNSSMLSANQTLLQRKLHDRRTLSMYFQPMKVQQDSFEERSESPDLPEPLYEEVGDFGLQVLKSLETSFRSSSIAETQEVPDQPPLRLVLSDSGHLD